MLGSSTLCSSIDLGTNTCLLLIAEVDSKSKRVERIVSDHSTVVRLGQGVDKNRELHPDAIKRTLDCLKKYSELVRAQGLDPGETLAVATSQARDSKNGASFFRQVEEATGFKFRILSGDDEAKYTFLGGLLPDQMAHPKFHVVIDIGGGSTEFRSFDQGESVDMGSVRFTERFLKSDPVTDEEFWACQDEIDLRLEPLLDMRAGWKSTMGARAQLVAVAGTATTLAQWHLGLTEFSAEKIDGTKLTVGDVHRMVEELKMRTTSERKALPGVGEGRADVLLAGAMILWRSMELLDFKDVVVSTRGLRFGVFQLS